MADTKCKRGFQSHVMCDCEPTHPLTPREKVAAILDDHTTVGGTSASRTGRVNSDELSGLILTALAPGSGDHAELARLAESLMEDARRVADMPRNEKRDEQAGYSALASVALTHLLAENAALRARLERTYAYAEDNGLLHLRATEAERKLAEADQVIREISEAAQITRVRHLARTFLSKEAERG